MLMLLGQYSIVKTTFIKHLLGNTYPGAHIGPEPTTDRFVVVMNGPDGRSISGNTVAVQADMPYSGLTTFGTTFLSKFDCSQMQHPVCFKHYVFCQRRLGGYFVTNFFLSWMEKATFLSILLAYFAALFFALKFL